MNSPEHIERYTREVLRAFKADPPETDTQEAYFDAVVNFAIEGMGIAYDDPDVGWVEQELTTPPLSPRQVRRAFQVINGGLNERND